MKVIIFGAGVSGRIHALDYIQNGHEILYFIDNDINKQGSTISLEMPLSAGGGKWIILLNLLKL